MGGKGKGGAPPGGDAITWGPAARSAGWGWDKQEPEAAPAAPEPAPAAAAAPEQAAVQEQAAPAAAEPQGPIGEPIPPGKATEGSISTTKDTGKQLASSITAPEMWTDQMKKGANAASSMTTTGQV